MKKLLLLLFFIPSIVFSQAKRGYAFIGAGLGFVEKQESITGRFNVGVLPSKNAGIGFDLQYIKDYGVPVLADLRFISSHIKSSRLTIGLKAGTNIYDKAGVKGAFTYGAEAGLIFGKANTGFYISAQYLSMQYNSKIASFKNNIMSASIGVKFL